MRGACSAAGSRLALRGEHPRLYAYMPGVRGGQKDESAMGAWTWERNVSVAQGEQVLERTQDKYEAEQVRAA